MQTVADVVTVLIVPQEFTCGERHVQGLRAGTQGNKDGVLLS